MNIYKRINRVLTYKKMSLSFLYLFILFVTTFHHHPIDFAESKSLLKTIPSTTSHYSFTVDECPIINFSKNSFNSTFTSHASTELTFQFLKHIVLVKNTISKNRYRYSYSLRGPPNYII